VQTTASVTLLNIGNTHTQIATAEQGRIAILRRVATSALSVDDVPSGMPLALASVVPAATRKLQALNPLVVTAATVGWLDWSAVDVSTLGADRIANAAALATGELPAVCIDCGTAITFEILGAGACFLGGSISPGRGLMRRALHDYTAQLPLLPPEAELAEEFGINTVAAMTQGIDRGAIGMVRELLSQAQQRLGAALTAVAVGGDRHFFLRHMPELSDGGDDFTLRGIYKIWEKNYAC